MARIEFHGVSKYFVHGRTKLLRAHLVDSFKKRKKEVFYALHNVSFSLDHGQSMAVVGRNGAGKSTLLSLVAGLCPPSEGRVHVEGRVAALLELGSGFHPDLTGMENIRLNAALLGVSRARLDQILQSIVDFAEIGTFLNDPVRTYSNGMVMRLGFAVAAHVDPDILIIDEVLGVGDQRFQMKCFDKILECQAAGKILLFVSHVPTLIRQFCQTGLWLEGGEVMLTGPVDQILEAYSDSVVQRTSH